MTWVKIDDRYATHQKMLKAGALSLALDVAGMCYAAGHDTDGYIPTVALTAAAPFLSRGQALAAAGRLVEAGRWKPVKDGWQIHDYLTYNPSSVERDNRRKAAAARTGRWRGKKRVGDASQNDERRNGDTSPARTGDVTPPIGSREPERQLSTTYLPRDASQPDASPPGATPPPSPESGDDSAPDNPSRCRHHNDPATCGLCSPAVGTPPPRAAIERALRVVADQEAEQA